LSKTSKVAVAAYHYPEEHEEVGGFLAQYGFSVEKMRIKDKWYIYGWRRT
jgi:hypothetical protein